MTKYFEVLRRDGPARMGKLLSERQISTPALITKDDYVSVGSVYSYASLPDAIEAGMALQVQRSWPYFHTCPQPCAQSRPWICHP